MSTELRLALLLTRGSDRREWWRAGLTAAGAALATGLGLAIAVLASLDGQYRVPFGAGVLDQPGTRDGAIAALMLLFIPVAGFLGQCARIGAVHRDRRLAALRLVGATPAQVRRIGALESGLACLAGSAVTTLVAVTSPLLRLWRHPNPAIWFFVAVVAVLVPVLGAAVSALALRRVVASPLGRLRRVRPAERPGRAFRVATGLLTALVVLYALGSALDSDPHALPFLGRSFGHALGPLTAFALCLLVGAAAVWLAGWSSYRLGRACAARAQSPALLIAAERLRDDPWAAARTHAAVLLVTVVGTGFVGVRQALLAQLHAKDQATERLTYYTTGLDLTAASILVAMAIILCGLAVGTAESLATRRRGLAAQAAAGVPRAVLGRAMLLETALPLAPAVLLAGVGGMAIGVWYSATDPSRTALAVPYLALLVPPAVYGACLLAAATALPLLRRRIRPAELRYT